MAQFNFMLYKYIKLAAQRQRNAPTVRSSTSKMSPGRTLRTQESSNSKLLLDRSLASRFR